MATYLGFDPHKGSLYYFVSYNDDDARRIAPIAQGLCRENIPLWYDFGIPPGEKWEPKISGKIADCQGVILFFTKGILEKEESYVYKEYTMATEYFDKKVYVVLLDDVDKSEIPVEKVPWWVDVQESQCIHAVGVADPAHVARKIMEAISAPSSEEDEKNDNRPLKKKVVKESEPRVSPPPADTLARRLIVSGVLWLLLAVLQMVVGSFDLPWLRVIGLLNVVTAIRSFYIAKKAAQLPPGTVARFRRLIEPIVILAYNLLGGLVGAIGSLYYFVAVRGYVMKNRDALLQLEQMP